MEIGIATLLDLAEDTSYILVVKMWYFIKH